MLCAQSLWTLCNLMDCSPPGSSVHGIFQARILEWVAMPFSRVSPGYLPCCRQILLPTKPPGKPLLDFWMSAMVGCTNNRNKNQQGSIKCTGPLKVLFNFMQPSQTLLVKLPLGKACVRVCVRVCVLAYSITSDSF